MQELIERLEKAAGPDRVLDCAIEAVLAGKPIPVLKVEVMPGVWEDRLNAIFSYTAPTFTASIDAALSLVPSGGRVRELGQWSENGSADGWFCRVYVWRRNDAGYFEQEFYCGVPGSGVTEKPKLAPTPALALCIAALKARSSCG